MLLTYHTSGSIKNNSAIPLTEKIFPINTFSNAELEPNPIYYGDHHSCQIDYIISSDKQLNLKAYKKVSLFLFI